MPEIPAARMLREVSTHSGHVANLARADFRRRLLQAGKDLLQFRRDLPVRATVTVRRSSRPWGPIRILFKPGQRLDVHERLRLDQIFLHQVEQIVAAGEVGAVFASEFAGAGG